MPNKTTLVSLSFFSSIWWIADGLPVVSVVEKYFRLELKYLILLTKKKK